MCDGSFACRDRPIGTCRVQTSWQNGADAMPVKLVLYFVDIVKVLSSKTDGLATVRSPPQLFNIVKLPGSKTDDPATVRSPLQLFNIVKLPFHIGPAVSNPPSESTARLLLLLPFHIGPAATNPLCETKFDLLSQLPYFIVDAVYDLLLLPLLFLYIDSQLLVSTRFLILSFLVTWDREWG